MARLRWFANSGSWRPSQVDWCAAMARVQAEERKRILKFAFQRDAKAALLGRLMLRATVVRSEGVSNENVMFGRSERGKPELWKPGCTHYYLNLSHHGNHVVIAMETGHEVRAVGVDVMRLDQPRGQSMEKFFHTMRRNFTEGEWSHILAPPTHQQQLALFYRFWCLKESFIKAEGSGLSYGLQRLDFTPDPTWPPAAGSYCTGSSLAVDGQKTGEWLFEEAFIDSQHCVSVAVRGCRSEATPTFSEVQVHDLVSWLDPLTSLDHTHWTHFINKQ